MWVVAIGSILAINKTVSVALRTLEIIKSGENFDGLQTRDAQVIILVALSVDAHVSSPATDIPARIKI